MFPFKTLKFWAKYIFSKDFIIAAATTITISYNSKPKDSHKSRQFNLTSKQ